MTYQASAIEKKWQDFWAKEKSFLTKESKDKPKYYVLDMFPYPSGDGLHVGHVEGYTATDIVARYKRMQGFNVLHPMGWDAFGLPAEQYAIKHKVHPSEATARNVATFKRQINSLGMSYDWEREVNTTDPNYYKWTQWIFLKLHEKGLAYIAEIPVNWCPALGTVLANEEIINGKSERGDHPVIRKPMKQWILKITAYAERLLTDLEGLDWPENVKEMQRNWIGKSEGARIHFALDAYKDSIEVFTTRPETIYGATYMVLAPEHALVDKITTPAQKAQIEEYRRVATAKSDLDRTELNKEKSGVFTGAFAINPFTAEKIPVWIADYVLAHYGTGAIMAVPAHDERDGEFAQKFSLPVRSVINEAGVLMNSPVIDGLGVPAAVKKICTEVENRKIGQAQVQYRLRDWLFSRQRYWGEPFPILHFDDGTTRALGADELPVLLPSVAAYEPSGTGESPLATISDWVNTKDPKSGKAAKRETNTMPNWAGSCWYYLRFLDPKNDVEAFAKDKEKYWMPVDLYIGGVEHAVLHLLYARFWHKVLFDLGYVSTKEPFKKLFNQGMILGSDGEKMSKSRGNVVNPDDVISRYGADSLRLFEMFLGPLDKVKPWNPSAIEGVYRFLQKSWRWMHGGDESDTLIISDGAPSEEHLRLLHVSIDKITKDLDGLAFNTAISQLMICVNEFGGAKANQRKLVESFTKLLAPFAPHMAEELWQKLGHKESLTYAPWPKAEAKYLVSDTIKLVVQVNGKLKDEFTIAKTATEEQIFAAAEACAGVKSQLEGKSVKKRIYVPGRLVNFVVA